MVWPPNSLDLNPIKNSKNDLWLAIKESATSVPSSTIKKLANSVVGRLFNVIRNHGAHVKR